MDMRKKPYRICFSRRNFRSDELRRQTSRSSEKVAEIPNSCLLKNIEPQKVKTLEPPAISRSIYDFVSY